jgi:hypothetical protein
MPFSIHAFRYNSYTHMILTKVDERTAPPKEDHQQKIISLAQTFASTCLHSVLECFDNCAGEMPMPTSIPMGGGEGIDVVSFGVFPAASNAFPKNDALWVACHSCCLS